MKTATLYFTSQLTDFIKKLSRILSANGEIIQWKPILDISQSPVSSTILLTENDLNKTAVSLLTTRNILIISSDWDLESSIEWIRKGVTNCFSSTEPQYVATWLISELSKMDLVGKLETETETNFLQTVIDAIPAPIFYKDHLNVYRGCNTAFCDFIGFPHDKILGHSVYDIAPHDLAEKYNKADNELLSQGGTQRYESEVRYADGSIHDIEFNKAVFKRANGQVGGQVGVMLDITERNQLIKKLDKVSNTDPLTGARNRREFNNIVHEKLEKQELTTQGLSLLSVDIDYFKAINDRFGHGVGDQTLQLVTHWLNQQLRENDYLFRVGGEEFYILLCNTKIEEAQEIAQYICTKTSKHMFPVRNQKINITLSIGVTELNSIESLDHSLECIDKALYKAKLDGRNCVRLAV